MVKTIVFLSGKETKMKKTNPKSRIEIWDDEYINNSRIRQYEDEEAIILQCEKGSNINKYHYIVEVIQPEDYDDELELIKRLNEDVKRLTIENTHLYESLGKRNEEIARLCDCLQKMGVAEDDCERIRKGTDAEPPCEFKCEGTE